MHYHARHPHGQVEKRLREKSCRSAVTLMPGCLKKSIQYIFEHRMVGRRLCLQRGPWSPPTKKRICGWRANSGEGGRGCYGISDGTCYARVRGRLARADSHFLFSSFLLDSCV